VLTVTTQSGILRSVSDWVGNAEQWCTGLDALVDWCTDELRDASGNRIEKRAEAPRTFMWYPRVVSVLAEHIRQAEPFWKFRVGWLFYTPWETAFRRGFLETTNGPISWRNVESTDPNDVNPNAPDLTLRIEILRSGQHVWHLNGLDVDPAFQNVSPVTDLARFPPQLTQPWAGLTKKVEPWELTFSPAYWRGA
jgi:hypothetical protein